MESFERLVQHVIEQAITERDKPQRLAAFRVVRKARNLIGPARSCAVHHRKREKHYTLALEVAEKKLRKEGISVEVINPKTGFAFVQSGALCSGSISGQTNPKFQPKINQEILASVERAKYKMLEHRDKAERYEKYAVAFTCSGDTEVELDVEEVHFFKLVK